MIGVQMGAHNKIDLLHLYAHGREVGQVGALLMVPLGEHGAFFVVADAGVNHDSMARGTDKLALHADH
jgi:hypothetical protein